MSDTDFRFPFLNDTAASLQQAYKAMNNTGSTLARINLEMQHLFADQVRSDNQRLTSSIQQLASCTGPVETSNACALYVTEITRAHIDKAASWGNLLLRCWNDAVVPLVEAGAGHFGAGDHGREHRPVTEEAAVHVPA